LRVVRRRGSNGQWAEQSERGLRATRCRRAALICLGVVGWLLATRALAQSDCVQLSGELPGALAGCAPAEQVCQSYVRALAADGGEGEPVLPLHVRVSSGTDAARGAVLEISAAGAVLGQRTLSVRAGDCAALPDALALVLALLAREAEPQPSAAAYPAPAVDDALPGQPRAPVDLQPSAAAYPAPAVDDELPGQPRAVSEPPSDAASGVGALGAGVGVWLGALPAAALALQLQAATTGRTFSLRLRASLLWPQRQRIAEGVVRMADYELAAEVCTGFRFEDAPRLALRLCGGPRAGLLQVRADEFVVQNGRVSKFVLYLGLLPELGLALGPRTSLVLSGGAALALVRPQFAVVLEDREEALPAPRWLRAELGLTLTQIF
jgi:hypothetical protein